MAEEPLDRYHRDKQKPAPDKEPVHKPKKPKKSKDTDWTVVEKFGHQRIRWYKRQYRTEAAARNGFKAMKRSQWCKGLALFSPTGEVIEIWRLPKPSLEAAIKRFKLPYSTTP